MIFVCMYFTLLSRCCCLFQAFITLPFVIIYLLLGSFSSYSGLWGTLPNLSFLGHWDYLIVAVCKRSTANVRHYPYFVFLHKVRM